MFGDTLVKFTVNGGQSTVAPPQDYIEAIFREENLASKVNARNIKPNGNVLPTSQTQLIGCFYDSTD